MSAAGCRSYALAMTPTHHHHDSSADSQRALGWTLLLIFSFMAVEVVGAWISGSLALLADAAHTLTDSAALALAWLGFLVARRSADAARSFGYARFEVLAGAFNGLAMVAIVGFIVMEASSRLHAPQPVLPLPMIVIGCLGAAVNLLAYRLLHGSSDHINVRGAVVHVLGDLLSSLATVIAGIVILVSGWMPIDPLLSLLVAALVLRSAIGLLRQAGHILLEGTPKEIDPARLAEALRESIPGVRDVHHVHVWSLSSGHHLATMHIRVTEGTDHSILLPAVKRLLQERFLLGHTTVQVCPEDCPDDFDHKT